MTGLCIIVGVLFILVNSASLATCKMAPAGPLYLVSISLSSNKFFLVGKNKHDCSNKHVGS